METILSFISNVLASILPSLFKKKEMTESDKQYEQLRFDVAKALDLYACYYHEPVDLAKQPDFKLPEGYIKASAELRNLSSTASALALTISGKGKKLLKRKSELLTVSRNLIGLSNSMCTPFNCNSSYEDRRWVRACEAETRELLHIDRDDS